MSSWVVEVATVQKPVPAFKASAVVDGFFKRSSSPPYHQHLLVLALCLGDVPAQAGRSRPGLQGLKLLLTTADRNMSISHNYGTLIEDEGIALRGLFIIDPKSILRCVHSAGSSTKNVSASTKKTSGSSKFVWPPVPADRAKLR
ncbi:uncharacterized protein BXZ73DRAFT_110227 [Epithele typhae]|uniref:uncharacterized protein n=1 Tax=Epithele typhae TaxID=378194 RepID=UPI002008C3A2|nr:uncharacterized protein BXZ73DRAFT_110227 [Epithele typhae]KAH9907641.1 hypothetical protein BXZ73DRAFT_110227 [Epithele typhae]